MSKRRMPTPLTQDSEGNDVYEDLELPDFSFTPKTIFQDDFLENNVSEKAFNVIESITEKGLETPEQIAEQLKNDIKSQDNIIFKSVIQSKKTKKVLYKGGIIELKEENPPETGYVAGVKKVHKRIQQKKTSRN